MAATQYFEQVQKIFIAFYQRPADPAGLKYWAQRVDAAGGDFGAVIDAFAASPEAVALYGAIDATTIGTVIDKLYLALFNTTPDAAGKQFYVDGFIAGTFSAGTIALNVLNGATGDDAVAVTNKVQVANNFTQQVDGRPLTDAYFGSGTSFNVTYAGDTDAQAARDILKGVTFNASTVLNPSQVTEQLKAKIADATDPIIGQSGGQTFTLTTGATDIIVGTSGNDTIIGDFATTTAAGTIQASDNVDGGAGVDTFKIYSYSTPTTQQLPASVKNVEVVEFVAPTATTLDVAKFAASGVTTLSAVQADAVTALVTGNGQGVKLNTTGTATAASTFAWAASATDTALNVELNGVTNAVVAGTADTLTITAAAAKTLNIASTGAKNSVTLAGAATIDTVNVTGGAALNLNTLAATVTTLGAAAATGDVTAVLGSTTKATVTTGAGKDSIEVASATGAVKVATGAGNDTVKVGAVGFDAASSSFDGGEGRDTVQITNGANLTVAVGKLFTNFEVLATGTGVGTYDVTRIAGIDTVLVDDAIGGAGATLSNVTNQNIVIAANQANVLTVNLKDSSGTADALTVTLDNQNTSATTFNKAGVSVAADKLVTTGVENLTFKSAGVITGADAVTPGTANSVALQVADTDLKTVTITGDQAFNLVTGAIAANLTKIDASAATGKVGIDASAALGALSILGGSGADAIKSGAAGATINAGKGNDTIDLTASAATKDVVIVNAGDAKGVLTAAGLLDTGAGKLESIAGFTTGQDVLDLGAFGFTAQQKSAWAVKSDLSAVKLDADVANFFVDTGVARGVAYDTTNGYLLVDANKDGNFNVATDLVIKVVGLNFADIGF